MHDTAMLPIWLLPNPPLPVKMSLAISVAGTLSCLNRLLWGAHLCSSGLTLGESVCQTQPNMMDRAIYLNTAVEIYKIYRNQMLGADEANV